MFLYTSEHESVVNIIVRESLKCFLAALLTDRNLLNPGFYTVLGYEI